jgi:hypothetical protein
MILIKDGRKNLPSFFIFTPLGCSRKALIMLLLNYKYAFKQEGGNNNEKNY